jgi:hypothetical protein
MAFKNRAICSVLKLSLIFLLASCEKTMDIQEEQVEPKDTKPAVLPDYANVHGIYVGTSDDVQQIVKTVKEFGANAVVMDVKDERGDVTCDLDLAPRYRKSIRIRNVGKVIAALRSKGIYTIARIVTFRDHYAVHAFSGFAIRNKDGSVVVDKEKSSWLNPYNEKVWDYVIQIAKAAAKVGFDEIQFDYVRFSPYKNPDADLGPRSESISRVEIITRFLEYAVRILHPLGVKVSADVFGCIIPGSLGEDTVLSTERLGQDWGRIAKTVDCICPMIYPSHWPLNSLGTKYPDKEPYKVIYSATKLAVDATKLIPGKCAVVRPFFQAFTATWLPKEIYKTYSNRDLQEQVSAGEEAGAGGFLLWNPRANYEAFH